MRRILFLFFFLFIGMVSQSGLWLGPPPPPIGKYLNGVFPEGPPGDFGNWTATVAFPHLTFTDPVDLIPLPGEEEFMLVEKTGRIWRFDNQTETTEKTLVLDIRHQVITCDDCGMLSMVLHPEFGQSDSPNKGYVYVFYRYTPTTNYDPDDPYTEAYLRLSRFEIATNGVLIDPSSELVLIQQYDRQGWHSGGSIFFDLDGFLYVSFGDEGGANDNYDSTQRLDGGFFSGIIRIDVDQRPDRSHPIRRQPQGSAAPPSGWPNSFSQAYFVPNDNPWLSVDGSLLEEFYAIGLRSPHRMLMDKETNLIWVGDVGQGTREEVSVIQKGDNAQWPYKEGSVAGPKAPPTNRIGNDQAPVFDYGRAIGNCIIGGFVYRGEKWEELQGKYIYGDHGTRNIFALHPSEESGEWTEEFLLNIPPGGFGPKSGISSFASDSKGNVYILKLNGTNQDGGQIYMLDRGEAFPEPPALLSETGAFQELTNLIPTDGIMPYDVNSPLWSDGAKKKRWIALPNDGPSEEAAEKVRFKEKENWAFPSGTVFIKHFELPTNLNDPSKITRLETRFIVVAEDEKIYGLTYRWNEAGTDAYLLETDEIAEIPIVDQNGSRTQVWAFPSRAQCLDCHTPQAGYILGVNTPQLNRKIYYSSIDEEVNQIDYWNDQKFFHQELNPSTIATLPQAYPLGAQHISPNLRIQSYISANCSHCHRPGGVEGAFDARMQTPLECKNLLGASTVSSNSNPGFPVIAPGNNQDSEFWIRDGLIGISRAMPPLAKNVIDTAYIQLLSEWINSMPYDYEPASSGTITTYLSDIEWVGTPQNGWGELELDSSNGEIPNGDGHTITINGQTYDKGLGVHAYSEIRYQLAQQYDTFKSDIGIDDECGGGSVEFKIYVDGLLAYSSPIMRQEDPARSIEVDVSGAYELKLIVTEAGDGNGCDHADWAAARLERSCQEQGCDEGSSFTISSRDWSLVNVNGKKEPGFEKAVNAFDNEPFSYWEWSGESSVTSPHRLEIDLGGLHQLSGFTYLPKIDETGFQYPITGFRLLGSENRLEWETLIDEQLEWNTEAVLGPAKHMFPVRQARYIRLEAIAEEGPPTIGELDLLAINCEEQPIGEINIALARQQWQVVHLDHNYENPIVVTGGPSSLGSNSAKVQIRNITSNSFEFKIEPWGCDSGELGYEWVPFVVVEEGVHVLPSGQRLSAGQVSAISDEWHTELFPLAYEQKPVLFVQEINSTAFLNGFPILNDDDNDQAQFSLRLQAAVAGPLDLSLPINWIAIDEEATKDEMRMEVGVSPPIIEDWQLLNLEQHYSNNKIGLFRNVGHEATPTQVRFDQEEEAGQAINLRLENGKCNLSNESGEEIAYWVTDRPRFLFGETIISTANHEESISASLAKIFPNPSKDGLFHIQFLDEDSFLPYQISVFNLKGQMLYEAKSSFKKYLLNLATYSAGTYLVEIRRSDRSIQLFRLIKM